MRLSITYVVVKTLHRVLHGIIAADAYGIPSTWIKLSDGVRGEGFKFFDYFKSVGRTDEGPFIIREKIIIDAILDRFYSYKLEIDLKVIMGALSI